MQQEHYSQLDALRCHLTTILSAVQLGLCLPSYLENTTKYYKNCGVYCNVIQHTMKCPEYLTKYAADEETGGRQAMMMRL